MRLANSSLANDEKANGNIGFSMGSTGCKTKDLAKYDLNCIAITLEIELIKISSAGYVKNHR